MSGPSVSPAACEAAPEDKRQLASLVRLMGREAAHSLANSHVLVVGIGGVGSWTAEALARSGIGQITLVDFDHISVSNINRQVHALNSTVGQSKVEAMRERMRAIDSSVRVQVIDDFVSPDNWPALLPEGVDAVVDCCDQFSAKLAMARWALAQPKPKRLAFVCVGAAGGKRHAQHVELADLSLVSHDPLLAKLRYTLRRGMRDTAQAAPKSLGLNCVFSREAVQAPVRSAANVQEPGLGGAALNCAGYGSTVTVTATFGLVAAGAVINQLASRAALAS